MQSRYLFGKKLRIDPFEPWWKFAKKNPFKSEWDQLVKSIYTEKEPLSGPIQVEFFLYLQNRSKEGSKFPYGTDSLMHYFSLCASSMRGFVYRSDSQIMSLSMHKRASTESFPEEVRFDIFVLE